MSPLLEFQQVSYTYPDQQMPMLQDLNFAVQPGEFIGILGANDSGKSTLAKLTNGLLLATEGQVFVDGIALKPDERTLHQVRQKVGLVFADPENQLVATTVEEEIAFGLGNLCVPTEKMRQQVDTYLQQLNFLQYAKRPPHQLSGGEQQKLCLASVLVMGPECLVLDEPLTFLDSASQQEIFTLLQEFHAYGKSILYLSSNPEELTTADRIFLLHQHAIWRECKPIDLWNNLDLLDQIGMTASKFMVFRDTLKQHGYVIRETSITPEAIVQDIIEHT